MKKFLSFLLVACMVLTLCMVTPVSAAETKTFTDTMEDDYPLVYDKSDILRFELNKDLELTLYGKWGEATTSSVKEEVYAVWKVDGDITAFSLDVKLVNGLGDPNEIKVEVSADGSSWQTVAATWPDPTFDDEIYFNYDMAYWLMTTLSNKNSIPAGCSYIKVTLMPYQNKDSANWNIMLDTLNVDYTEGGATETPSKPTETSKPAENTSKAPDSTSQAPDSNVSQGDETVSDSVDDTTNDTTTDDATDDTVTDDTTNDATDDTTDDTTTDGNTEVSEPASDDSATDAPKADMTWIWIVVGAVVLVGAGAAVFFLLKKKNEEVAE